MNPDLSALDDDKALLVAAIRIRAELNAELARLKAQDEEDAKFSSIFPNSAHHTPYMSPSNSITSSSAPHVMSTPLQSPVASVVVTPSSQVPATIPALTNVSKTARGKKPRTTKGQLQVSEKQKGSSLKRKKPDADPNAPKKPSNAFFWFCQEKRAALQAKFRGEGISGQHDLTKALAKLWSETAAEDKKVCMSKRAKGKEYWGKVYGVVQMGLDSLQCKKQQLHIQDTFCNI